MFVGIGVERCVGIFKPLHYHLWITRGRLHVSAACIWFYSLILSLPCVVGSLNWRPGELCEFYLVAPSAYIYWMAIYLLICVLAVVILYAGIIRAAQRQEVRMEQLQGAHPDGRLQRLKINIKAMRTYAMIVFVFAVTWTWASVVLFTVFLENLDFYQPVHKVGQLLLAINSVANPFIYALRMKSFREPMKRLLLSNKISQVHPFP